MAGRGVIEWFVSGNMHIRGVFLVLGLNCKGWYNSIICVNVQLSRQIYTRLSYLVVKHLEGNPLAHISHRVYIIYIIGQRIK